MKHNPMTPTVCTKCGWSGTVSACADTYCHPACPKCNYAVMVCSIMKPEFVKELEQLINRYSAENGSNTPDFIIAHYIARCLSAFDEATVARMNWYTPKPKEIGQPAQSPC